MSKSKVIKLGNAGEPVEKIVELLLGASGTQFFSGFFNISDADEYVQELKGIRALQTYNRMRRGDSQIKMALLALTHPIVNAQWKIQPAGDPEKGDKPTPQEEEAAKLINQWIFDDSFQWEQVLRQVCSFFWAGFSIFEKLYIYDGKYIRPKKLAARLQTTIVEWNVQDEELLAVKQYISGGNTARQVWIPADKLVIFVYDREGDDFRGQSALRAAYKHWFYKDTFYRIQGMQIERWALGIPKITQTDSIVSNPNKTKAIEMAKNLRAHEKGYAFVPKGFDLELLDSSNGKMVEPQGAIDHHNKSILKAIMAQFLELGVDDTGSRAVGKELKDFYLMGLSFASNYICEVIKTQMFTELTRWNFGEGVRPPRLVFEGIQPMDLQLLSTAYSQIVDKGGITMDDPTEAYIRKQLGMPPQDMETSRHKPDPTQPPTNNDPNNPTPTPTPPPADPKAKVPKKAKQKRIRTNAPIQTAPNGYEPSMNLWFWRPLTEAEQYVSLREITGKLEDSKEMIVRATRDARSKAVDELAGQIAEVVQSKDPSAVQDIDYSNAVSASLVAQIQPVLQELVGYGRDQVNRELDRQSKKIKAAFPGSKKYADEQMKKYLDMKAEHFSEISLDKLVDQARIEAANSIRTGTYSASDIRSELEAFSENTVRVGAGYTVNEAFAFGREQAAQDRKEEIDHAEYSAILDGGTCAPCEAMDGQEFAVDSPEYDQVSPPLYSCEGGNQCRCIWVYVSNVETAP